MTGFNKEAQSTFDFLLKTGVDSPVAEVAEIRFAEATGLVKYPFLAAQITLAEYDQLIGSVQEARQKRFRNLITDTDQIAAQRRAAYVQEEDGA